MAVQTAERHDLRPYGKIIDWARRHPVWAFIILAYILSWLVWAMSAFLPADQDFVVLWAFRLGTFGPAVAAIILAWLLDPTPTQVRPVVWWSFFFGGSLFGWLYHSWKGDITYQAGYPVTAYILAAITMLIWGFMVAGIVGHAKGIRNLMRRQVKAASPWLIALAVFAPLVIEFAGLGLTNLFGANVQPWLIVRPWDAILPLVISVIIGVTITGGGNEEPGWRGFMQAHLQKQFSPLITGIIVGITMGLWHFPLHFLGYYAGIGLYDGVSGLLFRIVSNIVLGIAFTWLYNRSRGSLLVVILLHVSINTSAIFITSTPLTQILMFIASLSLIPLGRMWRKLSQDEIESLL